MKSKLQKKLTQQAERLFMNNFNGIGKAKTKTSELLHGRRSIKEQARIVGKAASDLNLKNLKLLTPIMAQEYLTTCRDKGLCQKYLSTIKCSLQRALFKHENNTLTRVIAFDRKKIPLTDKNRAYTNEQIRLIMTSMNDKAKLSTLIAVNAGLRVEELLTIRRLDEATVSSSRSWSSKRFIGREEGVRYILTGKTGLRREILISKDIAELMENTRLTQPKTIIDRKHSFVINYDLLGGKRLSDAFSRASIKTLGWSNGAHGLRFTYAQNRMDNELINFTDSEAKLIISQELGHFREEITDRYLEPYSKRT
ncbi:site-specific integrase [Shewanella baltica]|nr:integrase [Shewanella baltica]AEH16422.1 phage integrase family protein [Shewanella baltica OS117]